MKIRKIALTLKHTAEIRNGRGTRWVGMDLSAEAELNDRERLSTAVAKLADQLSAEFNNLWRERIRNGAKNSAPASQPISNATGAHGAPPVSAEAHAPDANGSAVPRQAAGGGRDEEE